MDNLIDIGSKLVAQSALKMVITPDRDSEKKCKEELKAIGVSVAAIDFGGEFIPSINKIIEKIVSLAKKEKIINENHSEEGGVAGAAREAIAQMMNKAIGLNVGGKISVARKGDHVAVAVFFGIGMLHLNEVAIGLGHRAI